MLTYIYFLLWAVALVCGVIGLLQLVDDVHTQRKAMYDNLGE